MLMAAIQGGGYDGHIPGKVYVRHGLVTLTRGLCTGWPVLLRGLNAMQYSLRLLGVATAAKHPRRRLRRPHATRVLARLFVPCSHCLLPPSSANLTAQATGPTSLSLVPPTASPAPDFASDPRYQPRVLSPGALARQNLRDEQVGVGGLSRGARCGSGFENRRHCVGTIVRPGSALREEQWRAGMCFKVAPLPSAAALQQAAGAPKCAVRCICFIMVQDAAYYESLRADREKAEAAERERREAEQAAAAAAAAAEAEERRQREETER